MTVLPPLPSPLVAAGLPIPPAPAPIADFLAALEAVKVAAPEAQTTASPDPTRSPPAHALPTRAKPPAREQKPPEAALSDFVAPVFAAVIAVPPQTPGPVTVALPVPADVVTAGPAPQAEITPLALASPPVAEPRPAIAFEVRPQRLEAGPLETPRVADVRQQLPPPDAPASDVPAGPVAGAVATVLPAAREQAFLKQLASCETTLLTRPVEREPLPVSGVAPEPPVPKARIDAPAQEVMAVEEAAAPIESPATMTPDASAPQAQAARPKHDDAPPSRMQLAFGARLALAPSGEAVKPVAHAARVESKPAGPRSKQDDAAPASPAPRRTEASAPEPARSRALRAPEDHPQRADAPADEPLAAPETARAVAVAPPRAEREIAAPERPSAEIDVPRPATPATPPPKATPVARDIRIEVASPDRKVEVRLVERAGDVQFAVRTPDERLAGSLREHLPLLSSRLEQSGFHADQWHAAEANGPARRLEVAASSEAAGQSREQGHGGGREQPDRDERRPAPRDERSEAKQKGKTFEWLMQSLR